MAAYRGRSTWSLDDADMSQKSHGPFARAFVLLNRVFGAGAAIGGIYLLGIFVIAIVRGRAVGEAWAVGAFGLGSLVAGIVYLRAPLFRPTKSDAPRK